MRSGTAFRTRGWRSVLTTVAAVGVLALARPADAGCGCDKPPPPRAAIRPFVAHENQTVDLFDPVLVAGEKYDVLFRGADGSFDWSLGRAEMARDFADGAERPQLRVTLGRVSLGPCAVSVFHGDTEILALPDDQFTVAGRPVALHDMQETITRAAYRAAVARDGTVFIPLDVSGVTDATSFVGQAIGFPLLFGAESIMIYNEQGFLMQLLDPTKAGLFSIEVGAASDSTVLDYWRHEFRTYKQQHRQVDGLRTTGSVPDWHADGSYHVDHDHLVIAVRGTFADGSFPAAGATPPFTLSLRSVPAER